MKKVYIENCKVRAFESLVKEIFDSREGETSWTSGLTVYTGSSKELAVIWDDFTAEYGEEE